MPDCAQISLNFPSFDRRKIEANFTEGNVSSDGGLMLLRQADLVFDAGALYPVTGSY